MQHHWREGGKGLLKGKMPEEKNMNLRILCFATPYVKWGRGGSIQEMTSDSEWRRYFSDNIFKDRFASQRDREGTGHYRGGFQALYGWGMQTGSVTREWQWRTSYQENSTWRWSHLHWWSGCLGGTAKRSESLRWCLGLGYREKQPLSCFTHKRSSEKITSKLAP